ncbi:hypothetical protein FB45DRAFT_933515 [Roridomyces roridus]|uniref:Uncharacterized protein n=1 Tax=Roridomyces roridus TaxID=1738132 RepID=A0AAD7BD15_9AGAR|nr:hypothetical protein FB45DRAFT_933515 [Roridomyces roridus]
MPSVMAPTNNVPTIVDVLISSSNDSDAEPLQPAATITGSFSITNPDSPMSASSDPGPLQPTSLPAGEPPPEASTSAVAETTFNSTVNNPIVIASIVVTVVAVTIFGAVLVRLCDRKKRRRVPRKLVLSELYHTPGRRSSASLSIKGVFVSPPGTPPRSPPPILPPIPRIRRLSLAPLRALSLLPPPPVPVADPAPTRAPAPTGNPPPARAPAPIGEPTPARAPAPIGNPAPAPVVPSTRPLRIIKPGPRSASLPQTSPSQTPSSSRTVRPLPRISTPSIPPLPVPSTPNSSSTSPNSNSIFLLSSPAPSTIRPLPRTPPIPPIPPIPMPSTPTHQRRPTLRSLRTLSSLSYLTSPRTPSTPTPSTTTSPTSHTLNSASTEIREVQREVVHGRLSFASPISPPVHARTMGGFEHIVEEEGGDSEGLGVMDSAARSSLGTLPPSRSASASAGGGRASERRRGVLYDVDIDTGIRRWRGW